MSIENEIKQKKFKTHQEKLMVNILYTASWVSLKITRLLKPYEITLPQFNVLRILRGQQGKPMKVLSITERMVDRSSNASRLVEKLKQKGFVERVQNRNDRRSVDVRITESGLKLLSKIDESIYDWQREIIKLSEEEINMMNDMLDKIRS